METVAVRAMSSAAAKMEDDGDCGRARRMGLIWAQMGLGRSRWRTMVKAHLSSFRCGPRQRLRVPDRSWRRGLGSYRALLSSDAEGNPRSGSPD